MKPVTVDGTQHSAVVLCRVPGCGWRDVATGRGPVLRAAADHYLVAHADAKGAEETATVLRRRAGNLVATRPPGR